LGTTTSPPRKNPYKDVSIILPLAFLAVAIIVGLGLWTLFNRSEESIKPGQVLHLPVPVPLKLSGALESDSESLNKITDVVDLKALETYEDSDSDNGGVKILDDEADLGPEENLLLSIFTALPKKDDDVDLFPKRITTKSPPATEEKIAPDGEPSEVSSSQKSKEDSTSDEDDSSELGSVELSVGTRESSGGYKTPEDISTKASEKKFSC